MGFMDRFISFWNKVRCLISYVLQSWMYFKYIKLRRYRSWSYHSIVLKISDYNWFLPEIYCINGSPDTSFRMCSLCGKWWVGHRYHCFGMDSWHHDSWSLMISVILFTIILQWVCRGKEPTLTYFFLSSSSWRALIWIEVMVVDNNDINVILSCHKS